MNRTFVNLSLAFAASLSVASLATAAGYYTLGHGDVRAYYEAGQLKLRYQLNGNSVVNGVAVDPLDESEPGSFELDELVTFIPDTAFLMPDLPDYSFIGAAPGEPLWYVPEVQEEDRPWLGFSTEELSLNDWAGPQVGDIESYGSLKIDLMSVSGPSGGEFSLFQSGPVGDALLQFATSDGIDAHDTYKTGGISEPAFPATVHAHASWFFTQPGFYDVTLKFSGTHLIDGYKEAIGSVRFAVAVPEPGAAWLALVAFIPIAARIRRQLTT